MTKKKQVKNSYSIKELNSIYNKIDVNKNALHNKVAILLFDSEEEKIISYNHNLLELIMFNLRQYKAKISYMDNEIKNDYINNLLKQPFIDEYPLVKSEKQGLIFSYQKSADHYFKLFLKNQLELNNKASNKKINSSQKRDYSQKQIAIAYYLMGITITEDNYFAILKKHSKTTSNKILQKRITKSKQITAASGNKSSDTKHLKDLEAVRILVSGIKNKKAMDAIDLTIKAFKTNVEALS